MKNRSRKTTLHVTLFCPLDQSLQNPCHLQCLRQGLELPCGFPVTSASACSAPKQLYHCQPLAELDKAALSCDLHQYSLFYFHENF